MSEMIGRLLGEGISGSVRLALRLTTVRVE